MLGQTRMPTTLYYHFVAGSLGGTIDLYYRMQQYPPSISYLRIVSVQYYISVVGFNNTPICTS